MTEKEIVYDIMMEAEGFQLSDDARFDEYDYVAYIVREKRARTIRDAFRRNGQIYSETAQNLHQYSLTKVDGADDPLLGVDTELGKVTIPELISFHDDNQEFSRGMIRVSNKDVKQRFYQTSFNKFQNILDLGNERKDLFKYFFIRGTELFVYPFVETINMVAILENPLDGFVLDTAYRTALVSGTSYTVVEGSITSNSVVYQAGDVFTASATTFTGSGKVVLTTPKRAMTSDDVYPISAAMVKQIKSEIYTNEFRVQQLNKPDSRNDSADNQVKESQS